MFRTWGTLPRVIAGFAVIAGVAITLWFIALRNHAPIWVLQTIWWFAVIGGITVMSRAVKDDVHPR